MAHWALTISKSERSEGGKIGSRRCIFFQWENEFCVTGAGDHYEKYEKGTENWAEH